MSARGSIRNRLHAKYSFVGSAETTKFLAMCGRLVRCPSTPGPSKHGQGERSMEVGD
jgi:hypothetical protein